MMTRPKVPPGRLRRSACSPWANGDANWICCRPKATDGAGVRKLQEEKAEGEYKLSPQLVTLYLQHSIRHSRRWDKYVCGSSAT
jgi:hypothetical protein